MSYKNDTDPQPWVFVDPDGVKWPSHDCYVAWCKDSSSPKRKLDKPRYMHEYLLATRRATGAPQAATATYVPGTAGAGAPPPPPAPPAPTGPAPGTLAAVLAERKTQHGDFTDHAHCSQAFKIVLQDHLAARHDRGQPDLTYTQMEGVEMILHKIARIVAGDANHDDHWRDIAGYATITADRLQR